MLQHVSVGTNRTIKVGVSKVAFMDIEKIQRNCGKELYEERIVWSIWEMLGLIKFTKIHWASYFLLAVFSESLILIEIVQEGRLCVQCFPNFSSQGPFFLQNVLGLVFQGKCLGNH